MSRPYVFWPFASKKSVWAVSSKGICRHSEPWMAESRRQQRREDTMSEQAALG